MASDDNNTYFGLFGADNEALQRATTSECKTSVTRNRDDVDVNRKICCICESNDVKYKCPKCNFRSCSLVCVSEHKISFECTGVRDRTPFVKISQFTENQFHDGKELN